MTPSVLVVRAEPSKHRVLHPFSHLGCCFHVCACWFPLCIACSVFPFRHCHHTRVPKQEASSQQEVKPAPRMNNLVAKYPVTSKEMALKSLKLTGGSEGGGTRRATDWVFFWGRVQAGLWRVWTWTHALHDWSLTWNMGQLEILLSSFSLDPETPAAFSLEESCPVDLCGSRESSWHQPARSQEHRKLPSVATYT